MTDQDRNQIDLEKDKKFTNKLATTIMVSVILAVVGIAVVIVLFSMGGSGSGVAPGSTPSAPSVQGSPGTTGSPGP